MINLCQSIGNDPIKMEKLLKEFNSIQGLNAKLKLNIQFIHFCQREERDNYFYFTIKTALDKLERELIESFFSYHKEFRMY